MIKKKIGVSTYQTEKFFKLIQEETDTILIPRGFINKLVNFCQENEIPFVIVNNRNKLPAIKFKSKINLYDYQKAVTDEICDVDSGVIVAPSGSGKTIIGLDLIAKKSQPALIIVHRKQLLDQWVERIQSFLGIPKAHIGRISGVKKAVGKQITVAMIQSLIKMENVNEIANQFGIVIVDECHHIPAKTFRELICKFNPFYLYGLTATPKRKYNDEKLIYYYIGGIIATGQLFGEGVDFNVFNCLFLVYPFSFEGKLVQYIGRIRRNSQKQIIYDYYDIEIPFFDKQFKQRLRQYKKLLGVNIFTRLPFKM